MTQEVSVHDAATSRFMGLVIEIAQGALVPRLETETLGYKGLDLIQNRSSPLVVDMCCGAGNLACAIAKARPDARVIASDVNAESVALAARNAARLGLGNVEVLQGDLFEPVRACAVEGKVDLVVCNPPYISTARLDGDRAYLLEREPRVAFDGGPYGISIHLRVIRESETMLRDGGWLAMEFGDGQHRQLELLLKRSAVFQGVQYANFNDIERVVFSQKASSCIKQGEGAGMGTQDPVRRWRGV